jgi:hypothetical protein
LRATCLGHLQGTRTQTALVRSILEDKCISFYPQVILKHEVTILRPERICIKEPHDQCKDSINSIIQPELELNSLQFSLIISLILTILKLPSHFDQIHKSTTMKSFYATSLLALIAATTAIPFPAKLVARDPTQDQVQTAIESWRNDVVNVNSFLDSATSLSPADLQSAAQTALDFANDEPVELGVLSGIPGLADNALGAIQNLQETFGNVPSSLQNIINNPSDTSAVNTQLEQINNTRCCNVLPALDILWQACADDEGISNVVDTSVPRPNSCSQVVC